jgi:non-specific protein-tyrosine kinase
LLITSALAGEGKTTTALNLAITMAASAGEGEVLLVETDFRRPEVQQCLGTRAEAGLADYLLEDVDISRLFITTPIPGLTVVPMGKRVENPTALVTSRKMEQFFQAVAVQERYRYILLDSSPVLLTSETKALALHADAVILVVHAGKTPREMIVKAIDIVGAESILGCVFNSITAFDSHAFRYYYSAEYFTNRP